MTDKHPFFIDISAYSASTYRVEVKCMADFGDGSPPEEEWLPCGLPFSTKSQAEHTKEKIARELLKVLRETNPGNTYRLVRLTHASDHYSHREELE